MNIGCHVSIAGGIFNAPKNAHDAGCEVYQVFTRSPRGGSAPKLTASVLQQFRAVNSQYGFTDYVIHTPYYINFASTKPPIRYGSIKVVREELERGSIIGAQYVVTHLGSTKDAGPTVGFHKTWRSIQRILEGYRGSCQLTLEISAGAGDLVGGTFEQLAGLIKEAEAGRPYQGKIGICLDTCHLFAAGYDIRTAETVNQTIRKFDRIVGLHRLKFLHANDSKFSLGGHRDRHEHIGRGEIGLAGFRALLHHPKLKDLNVYLETEPDGVQDDIAVLKKIRDE